MEKIVALEDMRKIVNPEDLVKIVTLGDFDIIINNQSIIEDLTTHKRLIKLLKYFLIHQNVKLLPEKIVEDLWIDKEFKNPLNTIRTQICRLRQLIDWDEYNIEAFFSIEFIDGYYIFTLEKNCEVDYIEFENVLGRDFENMESYLKEDFSKFEKLILSYKGSVLQEIEDEDWLIPVRSRFARFYIRGIEYAIDYFNRNFMYSDIISICEKAIIVKPYEESIHISFMEALMNLHQHTYALLHYEFYTRKLFNDLGIAPSKRLKELYKNIKAKEEGFQSNIDLDKIDNEMLKESNFGEVMFCDLSYFKFIYNFEIRNKDRKDKPNTGVGIITLEGKEGDELTEREMKKRMDQLKYVLFQSLRFGDIVSNWNESQLLLILYGLSEEGIQAVIKKIEENFDLTKLDNRLVLDIQINII